MDLLRVSEAALLLRVSTATVYRLLDRGQLHRVRVADRAIRIPEESIRDFINRGGQAA